MKYEQFADDYRKVIAFIEARALLFEVICRCNCEVQIEDWFWDIKLYVKHVIQLARQAGIEIDIPR